MSVPRILFVLTTSGRRGAEIQGGELARELNLHGIDAQLVALTPGLGPATGVSVLGRSAISWRTLRALRRAARGVDLVIAYGSSTLPACALALTGTGIPFIYRSIGDPSDWVRGRPHRIRTGFLFRRATHVVALWERARQDIEQMYSVPRSRSSAIPNARREDIFHPPSPDERQRARDTFGFDDQMTVLVMLGALSPEKQVDKAIEAMSRLPAAHLLIVGDGPERSRAAGLAAESVHGNVQLVGALGDPLPALHAADVLLLCSRTEGMPGVIIEAGLCGVPATATAVGTVSDLIDDGVSGIVVTDDSPDVLAAGVCETLRRRDAMGHAALARMRASYTWETVLPLWVDLISRTVAANSRR